MDGVFLLDKPAGITSMRAVERVKRLFGAKKAGHTGTLDPLATGVLAICLGQATRIAELLLASTKGYQAELVLGISTDTLDRDGTVTATRPLPKDLSEADIKAALLGFQGQILQRPPAFSALKIQGKRAYELARAGAEVQLAPRRVTIHSIALQEVDLPRVSFSCVVSKGTYIRALIRDLGEQLGCGAHMVALRRFQVGSFFLDDALTLEQIEQDPARAMRAIIPMASALDSLPELKVSAQELARLRNGCISRSLQAKTPQSQSLHRVLTDDGALLALLEPSSTKGWKIKRVFSG